LKIGKVATTTTHLQSVAVDDRRMDDVKADNFPNGSLIAKSRPAGNTTTTLTTTGANSIMVIAERAAKGLPRRKGAEICRTRCCWCARLKRRG
jgi:hypothetical protein